MTKQQLIDTIQKITDQSVLDDIKRLIELESDHEIFVTNPAQKNGIEQARSDVAHGRTIDAHDADKEIDEWLKE